MPPLDAIIRPEPQPFGPEDGIPSNGDGERHPDVIRLRHALSDPAAMRLVEANDFAALAERIGGNPGKLHAAFDYLRERDKRA
jgi:hypothetical protein